MFSVQTPAPVSNVGVSPSSHDATVTWTIKRSIQESSYITHIIIHLNGIKQETITRGTEIKFEKLHPYTSYTVGIQTQDGSNQKSEPVTKAFATNEAGNSRNVSWNANLYYMHRNPLASNIVFYLSNIL